MINQVAVTYATLISRKNIRLGTSRRDRKQSLLQPKRTGCAGNITELPRTRTDGLEILITNQ